jgi:hypothetical protein
MRSYPVLVTITKREQTKRPLFSRDVAKDNTPRTRRRLLADRADFVAGSIFLFESRDPEGNPLATESTGLSAAELDGRFAAQFSRRLRGLFSELKEQGMVTAEELTLFYWPQSSDARIRLAWRLRQVALTVRSEG